MGGLKIINEEQFNLLTDDIAKLIGKIQNIEQSFNAQKMRTEIVRELKDYLSTKNSLFKSLERESLELESNLVALKNVKKEFIECKKESELRLMLYSITSMFAGGVFSILAMWALDKF